MLKKRTMIPETALFALLWLHFAAGNSDLSYRALKFGNTASDYIVYQPNMAPLQNAFSACFWARSLLTTSRCGPHIMSYEGGGFSNEIVVSDEGGCNIIFGSNFDLSSKHSVSSGTWFHYCMTWGYSSGTQNVYLNGQLIGSRSTPSGRRLSTGGFLMLGNDAGSDGRSASYSYIFGGELYKLNLFSKELSSSEVLEMSRDKCTETELTYGDLRSIKWEELLQRSRNGNVREIDSGCSAETGRLWVRLSETLEELRNSSQLLDETRSELARVKEEKAAKDTELMRTEQQLNETLEDLARTRTVKEACETKLETKEQQLNETLEELTQTRKEKEAHKTSLDTKRQHLNETLDELESTENEKDMCHTDLATAEENLNTTTVEKEEALEELERKKEDLIRITTSLNQTQTELDQVRKLLEKANNTPPDCPLNSTITSYWDLLYSEDYFGDVISSEKLEVLYKSVEKLEYFVGLRVTEGMIQFMKHFHEGADKCPNSTE